MGGKWVAIDGSKFQAVASKRRAITRAQTERGRRAQVLRESERHAPRILPGRSPAVVVLAVLLPLAASAGEMGRYAPSSWSPRDLIAAPTGTIGFAPYFSFYAAGQARKGNGTLLDGSTGIEVGANSWMFTPVLFYAPPLKPLGVDWSITLAPAFAESGADARLTGFGQNITLFDNRNTGFGDPYVIPANLTWHMNPTWALSAQYTFWAPVGECDPARADNVGLGYWSHEFRGTVSYFLLGNPALLLSAFVHYEVNGRKEGFDLRPAPHTTLELGALMAFSERLICGLIAGGIWELGNPTGSDIAEDGQDRMFNVTVEATYWFIPGTSAPWRVIRAFGVRDGFEGTIFTSGLNHLF